MDHDIGQIFLGSMGGMEQKQCICFLRVFIVYIVLGMVKMHALPGLILWSSLWMAKIPAQQRLAVGITPPYLYQLSESFSSWLEWMFYLIRVDNFQLHDYVMMIL